VLLHGPDAAPLTRTGDGDRLPIEWLDIIPKQGGRMSNIPLFTFGQLGVRIYVLDDSSAQQSPSHKREEGKREMGALGAGTDEGVAPSGDEKGEASHQPSESTSDAAADTDRHDKDDDDEKVTGGGRGDSDSEPPPMQKGEMEGGGTTENGEGGAKGKAGLDDALPLIENPWKPPAQINWEEIQSKLEFAQNQPLRRSANLTPGETLDGASLLKRRLSASAGKVEPFRAKRGASEPRRKKKASGGRGTVYSAMLWAAVVLASAAVVAVSAIYAVRVLPGATLAAWRVTAEKANLLSQHVAAYYHYNLKDTLEEEASILGKLKALGFMVWTAFRSNVVIPMAAELGSSAHWHDLQDIILI